MQAVGAVVAQQCRSWGRELAGNLLGDSMRSFFQSGRKLTKEHRLPTRDIGAPRPGSPAGPDVRSDAAEWLTLINR